MKLSGKRALALIGVVAIAVPAAAIAGPKGKKKGHNKPHNVTYVFKGAYAGGGSVAVTHGNAHVRKNGLDDQTVAFDLASAKLVVADTTGDGVVDASDVVAGDQVVVKVRMPRKAPGTQPFAAKQLIDQTNPPVEEDEGGEEEPPVV